MPNGNRYTVFGVVEADDASRSSGGQIGGPMPSDEARLASPTSGRDIVVGDSIVRGAVMRLCGGKRDATIVCCFPGARVKYITKRI